MGAEELYNLALEPLGVLGHHILPRNAVRQTPASIIGGHGCGEMALERPCLTNDSWEAIFSCGES